MSEKKTEFLQIRLSEKDKKIIQSCARVAGEDMSQWVLHRVLSEKSKIFMELCEKLRDFEDQSFVFAQLNEFINGLNSEEFEKALGLAPYTNLNDFCANYLAAMIEHKACQNGIKPPSWIFNLPVLSEPYFGTTLKSLRLHLLLSSPPAFRRRNIFIDSGLGDRV